MWNWFKKSDTTYKNLDSEEFIRQSSQKGVTLLDVRTKGEFQSGHLKGAIHLDFFDPSFKEQLNKLPKEKAYFVYCRSGNRSAKTCTTLHHLGFENVHNLAGGMMELV